MAGARGASAEHDAEVRCCLIGADVADVVGDDDDGDVPYMPLSRYSILMFSVKRLYNHENVVTASWLPWLRSPWVGRWFRVVVDPGFKLCLEN